MSKLSFHHLLDAAQIKDSDIKKLITLADKYRKQGHEKTFQQSPCRGLILATLFFEPSTRTRFSFESAMYRLGGQVITLEQGDSSSIKKGETLMDTGRIVSNYSDIIVMRHPKIGSVDELAKFVTVPVINAGDGANQHPTQSLVDIYTISCEKKRLDNLKIGVIGDLKHGRAVNSFLTLMSRYKNNSFTLISHPALKINAKTKSVIEKNGGKVQETSDLESAIKDLDILYVTRIQEERFVSKKEFEKVKNIYRLDKKTLAKGRKDTIVMHALPRVNEIDLDIDDTKQAKYFEQAGYGVYMRMALLSMMKKN